MDLYDPMKCSLALKKVFPSEAEMEHYKKLVREDFTQLNQKSKQHANSSVQRNLSRTCTAAMRRVFRRGLRVWLSGVPVADLAKPAVRTTLTTAGKHAAIRLIRG